jgi:type IV secretory pathway VirB9-like protein
MPRVSHTLCLGVLALLAGCAGTETYPAATLTPDQLRVRAEWQVPTNCYVPDEDLTQLAHTALGPERVPTQAEWGFWHVKSSTTLDCTGKGKKKKCKQVPITAVDQANRSAVLKPTIANTELGTSGRIRYPYDPGADKIYKITTSPFEATWLTLPAGLKLAADLLLDTETWEVSYAKAGEDGQRQHLVAIRPLYTGLKSRGMLYFQNGAAIQLDLESQERPGMLRVSWVVPEPSTPPPLPPNEIPPVFDNRATFANYRLKVDGKGVRPAWMPLAVVDDGHSTLISLPLGMDALRVPIVSGIQQNGAPALVSSRLHYRPAHGYWLWAQGIWPALELRDASGIIVRAERQVPPPATQENLNDTKDTLRMDRPRAGPGPSRPARRAVAPALGRPTSPDTNSPIPISSTQ